MNLMGGGGIEGLDFNQLHVTGDLSIRGGVLFVRTNGYRPSLGDNFKLFNVAGHLSGRFFFTKLPRLARHLRWDTSTLMTDGQLKVVSKK